MLMWGLILLDRTCRVTEVRSGAQATQSRVGYFKSKRHNILHDVETAIVPRQLMLDGSGMHRL